MVDTGRWHTDGMNPLLEITSHINGKNAKVCVYADRIEWERGKAVSAAKITAGVMTGGLSLLATGVKTRHGAGVEMIPIHQVTSVTQRRDSPLNDVVSVITSGSTIDMRCSRREADQLRALILDGVMGRLKPQEATQPVAPAPVATPQGPPAGWYPDQQDPRMKRWWDGSRWTEHTQA